MGQQKKSRSVVLKNTLICIVAVFLISILGLKGVQAEDYDCDNQWLIDTCVWGCSATEGACGALCGAAEETCKWGCGATEDVCGALCNATEELCSGLCGAAQAVCEGGCYAAGGICEGACNVAEGACYAGCGTAFSGCVASIPFRCWPWDDDCYDDCYDDCEDFFNSCVNECDLGCSNCRLDCVAGCDIACENCMLPCSDCILDCESGCEIACDDCRLPCEEDCQFPCRTIGESCVPIDPGFGQRCADGLTCFPTFGIVTDSPTGFTCFSSETEIIPDDVCLSLYSPKLHEAAMDINTAMSYGTSFGGAVGYQNTTEVGTVYGPDGCYGCYVTECYGGTSDIEGGMAGCVGLYNSLDDFRGQSDVFMEEAGEIIVFVTMQVTDLSDGELIGTADCLSLEASALPIAAAFLTCNTIVDIVGCLDENGNLVEVSSANPPVALCTDAVTCTDSVTCVAIASINNGSYDPDGDYISINQYPFEPYSIGSHTVTLTVSDQYGGIDDCSANITVNDCTPPDIECPVSTTAECESDQQAVVDPGDAITEDCSEFTVTDPGPESHPLGETTVIYIATDASGNSSSCNTTVTVVDTTPPIIECPVSTTAECESDQQAVVDPGDAITEDCSEFTVTDPGPASYPLGETTVTYTATDASGNSSNCDTTVTIMDTTAPEILCNARDIVPPDAPISFTATASDICDEVTVEITAFDCFKFTNKEKRIDKTESCVFELNGNTINILDSGGVGTSISWTVVATDPSGNSATEECMLSVQNPGRGKL